MINYFYHQRIRKAVASFGAIFNNIYIVRQNSAGETISQVRVPLSYAPQRSFINRISQTINGEESERLIAIKLPRMSFEITSIQYDNTRQLPKMNTNGYKNADGQVVKISQPVPYNISFSLNVYAKSQDDALQVVEQIMPYFNPHYTLTIKPLDGINISEDVALTLSSISFQDDYDGALEQRRSIIYTLSFDMKVNFYGHLGEGSGVIEQVDIYIGTTKDGNTLIPTQHLQVTTDSDFGFTDTWEETPPDIITR